MQQNAKSNAKAKMQSGDPKSGESPERAKAGNAARMALSPSLNAVAVIEKYGKPLGELDLATLHESLNDSVAKIWGGDLKQCEAMLLAQAHALQAIFMNLARRAAGENYLAQYETHLRIALKAQSQCRATLETLASIKNPPVAIVRQANIANGPQQVNNGTTPSAAQATKLPRARTKQNSQTQLLEKHHGQRLDTRTTGAAGRTDQELEAVGAIKRPQNPGG